jgi:uncharacterized membrane protein YagU involved in acid resistance
MGQKIIFLMWKKLLLLTRQPSTKMYTMSRHLIDEEILFLIYITSLVIIKVYQILLNNVWKGVDIGIALLEDNLIFNIRI